MTKIKGDSGESVGWVRGRKPNDEETREIYTAWMDGNNAILDALISCLCQAADRGDSNSLVLWLMTLRGLVKDIDYFLSSVAGEPVATKHSDQSGS
jgi:hypothetical protein